MVATLQQMNENLRSLNQNPAPSPSLQPLVQPEPAEYRGLDEFFKGNPSQFQEGFALDAAIEWIQGMERIFRAMNCSETHKLAYATYMLVTEAENWKKETEFLKLEQGNMSVGEYAAKFEELARFCPYSELEVDGRSKCSKFESGLRPKLKRMLRHQEIADFATLVNKFRMYEDDLKVDELATPEKISPWDYGPQRNHMRERGVSTPTCNKCGRLHFGSTCPGSGNRCFYCREFGHIKRFCPKLDRRPNVIHAEKARDHGRKVTPSGAGTSGVDDPAIDNSPEEWGILPDSRLSERTSPKREDRGFEIGNSRSLSQARNGSLERKEACWDCEIFA
ncbi:hypothetical protein Lal_00041615 [Lupinus albus]|nr:hypothetical protein Lal_00041615 [Lupinus albus]